MGSGEGANPAPLLCSGESPPAGPKVTKMCTCGGGSRGDHEDDQRAGVPLLWRQAEPVGVV